eukprot:500022-Pelagomonas_calceolata.AAC.1
MDASRRSPATQSTTGANLQTLTAAGQHALGAPPGPALAGVAVGEGTLGTEGSLEHPHFHQEALLPYLHILTTHPFQK